MSIRERMQQNILISDDNVGAEAIIIFFYYYYIPLLVKQRITKEDLSDWLIVLLLIEINFS